MAVALEAINNYFVITEADGTVRAYPKKSIYYQLFKERISFFVGKQSVSGSYPLGLNGKVTLDAGASGSVDGISVDGEEIMSGAKATAQMTSVIANTFSTNTAQCTSVLEGHTCTVNGLLYTAVDGVKSDNTEFDMSGTDDECAADLMASINADGRSGTIGDVSATVSTDTVTLTTDVLGVAGDATTLAQVGGTITLGNATFENGVDAATITVNGLAYTAVEGVPADFTQFSIDGDDDAVAASLAFAVNGDVRSGTLDDVSATSTTDTVTFTQTVGGAGGKATTLAETGSTITISGATFDAPVSFDTTLTLTATNVAANINAYSTSYSAVGVGAIIFLTNSISSREVDGHTVASEVTTITTTDVDMGFETIGVLDAPGGDEFVGTAALLSFVRTNTGN